MTVRYQSGEEIRKGDRVLFHGEPCEIEFVADGAVGDWMTEWFFRVQGPGAMVRERKYYVRDPEKSGDLVFVTRAAED